ncbi:MAG: hypothetical protein M1830_002009 [Pleopsidium flavum]|nr:MAG: hypothetical protein M1830_002009 [Pleopsidium flavum]
MNAMRNRLTLYPDIPEISSTSASAESSIVGTTPEAAEGLTSSLYKSSIFSVNVGPHKDVFFVHEAILSASPVLEKMCTERINAYSSSACIELLDVDPELFALLLDFLYTGDFTPTRGWTLELEDQSSIEYCKEVRLYCLALKYQLHQLQALAIEKMQKEGPIPFQNLLRIAEEAYKKLEEGEGASFRELFKNKATRALKENRDAAWQSWIAAAVIRGGQLAADLFTSLALSNDQVPPIEASEAIAKLEHEDKPKIVEEYCPKSVEPAIDNIPTQVDSYGFPKASKVGKSKKMAKKKKTVPVYEEVPPPPLQLPLLEDHAICPKAEEKINHDECCKHCLYG